MIEKDPASFQKLLDSYFAAGEKLDKKEALRVAEEYLGQDAATLDAWFEKAKEYDFVSV